MSISTKLFGELQFDPDVDWFEASSTWNGNEIRLVFPVDEDTLQDNALASAEALWSAQAKWNSEIETFASEGLLEIKNNEWRDDDEPKLTAAQFLDRLTLETISIASDGDFEFWYNDGDLFGGHSIVVRGNLELGLMEVCTEG
jgi:hypothetical protein